MAKAKVTSQDFLALLDEQSDQPAPALGSFGVPSPAAKSNDASIHKGQGKVEPNLGQSRAKVRPKRESKLSQSEAKVGPFDGKLGHPSTKQLPKVEPQLRPHHEPKLSQSEAKVGPESVFSSLVGLQRDALRYVFESCRFRGSKISGPIVVQNLAVSLKSTPAAVRKAIQRLEQKGCLNRATYKDGRGGWTEYQIPDDTYGALLLDESRAKVEPNLSQSRAKLEPQLEPQLRPRAPSSSSLVIPEDFKTTTTGESELFDDTKVQLMPEWANVDFSPLVEAGFSRAHLIQLAKHGKLSAAEVSASIEFFAFDLKRNAKGKALNGPPLNFFMGILRKGIPYAPPENYESPAEEARKRTRELLERKERERAADEERIRELAFAEWKRGLSADELATLLPDFARRPGPVQDSTLRTHFESTVWPEKGQVPLTEFQRAQQEFESVSQQGSP